MNALTPFPPAASSQDAAPARNRSDGWTPDRQRAFLEAVAEGVSVDAACRHVGLSAASAYAFRKRAAGGPFALGWQAASLVARNYVADTLLARALDGQVETWTRADGATVSRHRYDNRLASTLLARLDRLADARADESTHHAARLVAQDFDAFLDLVAGEAAPARAGLFLAQRAADGLSPDLAPIAALARADCWLRTGAVTGTQVATADLDPADRAGWTADQWTRAEAAGLLALAPEPAPKQTARDSQLTQLSEPEQDRGPVWWCDIDDAWRTSFPPPEDFDGEEEGDYGDEGYERALSVDEELLVEAPWRAEVEGRRVVESFERDEYFAAAAGAGPAQLDRAEPCGGPAGGAQAPSDDVGLIPASGPREEEDLQLLPPPLAKPASSDAAAGRAGRARLET